MSVKRDNVFILELTAWVCLYVFIWIVWGHLVEIMGVGLIMPPSRSHPLVSLLIISLKSRNHHKFRKNLGALFEGRSVIT